MKIKNNFFSILFLIFLFVSSLAFAVEMEYQCDKAIPKTKVLFEDITKYLKTTPYTITDIEGQEICKHIVEMIYDCNIPLIEHPLVRLICYIKEGKTIPVELHLKFVFACDIGEKVEIYVCDQKFKITKNLSGQEV